MNLTLLCTEPPKISNVSSQGGINSMAWEKSSLRLCIAVESFLFFAAVRPDYSESANDSDSDLLVHNSA